MASFINISSNADTFTNATSNMISMGLNDSMTNTSVVPITVNASIATVHHIAVPSQATVIINNIVLPTICACGILGIILTVIVLSRKNMSTSTNCYLMGLAIADLLFLLLFTTILGIGRIGMMHPGYYISGIYSAIAIIFMNVFLMASIWLTVMLAIERYIAICQPFMAAKICTIQRARVFIGVIFAFSLVCRIVNFWEKRVVTAYNQFTNKTVAYMAHTELAYNQHYNVIYPWVVDVILASVIPFLLLLIFNARLIWEVRKSTHYIRRNLTVDGAASSVQREELQVTIMLISVVIVFFICQAPYVIYVAIASINTTYTADSIMVFRHIAMMLLTLKSAVNFILYCWFSEKFWMTLKRLLCVPKCRTKALNNQNGSYYSLRRYSYFTRDTTI